MTASDAGIIAAIAAMVFVMGVTAWQYLKQSKSPSSERLIGHYIKGLLKMGVRVLK